MLLIVIRSGAAAEYGGGQHSRDSSNGSTGAVWQGGRCAAELPVTTPS